ncbi:amidase domain-containing protein [Pseudalkalibacillus caeni]|uniref:Putative amidase domain-containing protein n=1 Tax=Exobacillus caeni TaxID=2574798 RepID=A0A5R9F331_9BACL|nr:amidase domain-containing protein [Pseudalkalibacillus caeni]TLS37997.1 hypothetical protein FCL54_05470 [Pseudalkalibacillus caeni]
MMEYSQKLQSYWEERYKWLINRGDFRGLLDSNEEEAHHRLKNQLRERKASIIRGNIHSQTVSHFQIEERNIIDYMLWHKFLVKQDNKIYQEERVEHRKAVFREDELISDEGVSIERDSGKPTIEDEERQKANKEFGFSYNRLAAVKYAERWWNDYNPAYKSFDVDCTNYISQCLRAGGAPMRGYPGRSRGWWFQNNNWSYSWSVAHAFRWHLSGSTVGLKGKEVQTPGELQPGDVVCYDFDGDGHWQHSTIVVDHDGKGMPLVNAHTTNSRMRYWAYEDSTAWTPEIKYKFFQIEG